MLVLNLARVNRYRTQSRDNIRKDYKPMKPPTSTSLSDAHPKRFRIRQWRETEPRERLAGAPIITNRY
jgi:hypothetical protein